jgi:hypothetical protein
LAMISRESCAGAAVQGAGCAVQRKEGEEQRTLGQLVSQLLFRTEAHRTGVAKVNAIPDTDMPSNVMFFRKLFYVWSWVRDLMRVQHADSTGGMPTCFGGLE